MDKIIISDTSCLIALSKIDKLDLLKDLFQQIIVTKDVHKEFGAQLPEWVLITDVTDKHKQKDLENFLDKGEASSIALALEYGDATLIIDEAKGRNIAQSYNIEIIGTIGIILLADKKGLISDVKSLILLLVNKGFRLSDKLIDKIIETFSN